MSKISFFFTKSKKKLELDHLSDFSRWQEGIPEGEKYRADFVLIKDERTLKQNNLYWAIIDTIVNLENDVDITKDVMANFFKYKFLSHTTNVFDEEITEIANSHELTKKEFVVYVERIINWCIQKHAVNPMPEDKDSYWKSIKK